MYVGGRTSGKRGRNGSWILQFPLEHLCRHQASWYICVACISVILLTHERLRTSHRYFQQPYCSTYDDGIPSWPCLYTLCRDTTDDVIFLYEILICAFYFYQFIKYETVVKIGSNIIICHLIIEAFTPVVCWLLKCMAINLWHDITWCIIYFFS